MQNQKSSALYIPLRLMKSIMISFVLTGSLMKMNSSAVVAVVNWLKRGFASPAPQFVKWLVLEKWGGKHTWVETGTYKGETTAHLARFSKMV